MTMTWTQEEVDLEAVEYRFRFNRWLKKLEEEMPKVGGLYRLKKPELRFICEGRATLEVFKGDIVMLVSTQPPEFLAKRFSQREVLGFKVNPGFDFRILFNEKVSEEKMCYLDSWSKTFEAIETKL